MKKNKLRDQDKDKINKINQDQIMNLLIVRVINYKNKNKNKDKKFNNALKAGASENKNEFKSHKDKNKSEAKPKKSNKMSTSDNTEKKKPTYINCDYCERWHSQSCFYKHLKSAEEK